MSEECPWCEKELDAEDIYRFGDLNDYGYFECPFCGGQFTINVQIEYLYYIEMGPPQDKEEESTK